MGSGQSGVFVSGASDSDVSVHFIDVGQGDSILVDSLGTDVLIDGGPKTAGGTVVNYLNQLNITHLGLVVATHMDEDHIGGLINVLASSIQIDKILINNQSSASQTFSQFITLAQNHAVIVAQRGQVYALTTAVNLTVFNPAQPRTFIEQNENSVVLKLQASQTSFLLDGDAGFDAEQNMVNAGLNLRSNVLKVGHHGSATATGESFLNSVAPTYAIISCALNNTYGHPAATTLQRLTDHCVTTYGTYAYGTIIATTDGNNISFKNSQTQNPIPTPNLASTPAIQPTTTPPTLTVTTLPTQIASHTTSNQAPIPTASIPEFPVEAITIATIFVAISASLIIIKRKLACQPKSN